MWQGIFIIWEDMERISKKTIVLLICASFAVVCGLVLFFNLWSGKGDEGDTAAQESLSSVIPEGTKADSENKQISDDEGFTEEGLSKDTGNNAIASKGKNKGTAANGTKGSATGAGNKSSAGNGNNGGVGAGTDTDDNAGTGSGDNAGTGTGDNAPQPTQPLKELDLSGDISLNEDGNIEFPFVQMN